MFSGSARWLSDLPATLPAAPKCVLSVSGHWEAPEFTVGTAEHPPMLYDYYGFPGAHLSDQVSGAGLARP